MVNTALYPLTVATIASAIPVFPDVGSTIVSPGFSKPFFSASSIIARPIRSLTLLAGLNISNFPKRFAQFSSGILFIFTMGVPPIVARILSKIGILFSPEKIINYIYK